MSDQPVKRLSKRQKMEQVEIEEEDGNVWLYEIRELSGPERSQYIEEVSSKMVYDKKGNPIPGSVKTSGMEENLISRHLWRCNPDGQKVRVEATEIAKFPSSTRQYLLMRCRELSGLGDPDEQKNA